MKTGLPTSMSYSASFLKLNTEKVPWKYKGMTKTALQILININIFSHCFSLINFRDIYSKEYPPLLKQMVGLNCFLNNSIYKILPAIRKNTFLVHGHSYLTIVSTIGTSFNPPASPNSKLFKECSIILKRRFLDDCNWVEGSQHSLYLIWWVSKSSDCNNSSTLKMEAAVGPSQLEPLPFFFFFFFFLLDSWHLLMIPNKFLKISESELAIDPTRLAVGAFKTLVFIIDAIPWD